MTIEIIIKDELYDLPSDKISYNCKNVIKEDILTYSKW